MDWAIITLSEVRKRKANTIWPHFYVEPKIWQKWTYLWNKNRYIYTHTHIFWIYFIYIHTHTQIHFQILFPYRLLQNTEYSSLCYIVGPCWLSILQTSHLPSSNLFRSGVDAAAFSPSQCRGCLCSQGCWSGTSLFCSVYSMWKPTCNQANRILPHLSCVCHQGKHQAFQ